jgi:hypothetical protein
MTRGNQLLFFGDSPWQKNEPSDEGDDHVDPFLVPATRNTYVMGW